MKTALLLFIFLATASSALADDAQITCVPVRAYVSQVGFVKARTQARATGLTAAESNAVPCEPGAMST
jgi:hypothetical protein